MRLNEHWTEERLENGTLLRTYQRGQNYWDRDAQAYLPTPIDLLADDRSAGFSHVHKGQAWKRVGRGGLHRAGFAQGQDVTYLPIGAADVAPVIEGNTATYADLWPGVDVRLTVSPEGIKEDLILRDSGAPAFFAWDVVTRAAVLDPSGEYIDPLRATVIGRLAAATVHDAAGVEGPATLVCDAESVRIELDPEWLDDPARVWPVTVDPTTITVQPDNTTGQDAQILSGNPTANYGTSLGAYFNGTNYWYSLIKFTMPETPAGTGVGSAIITFNQTSAVDAGTVIVEPVTAAWEEMQATWNSRLTGTPWSTPGGDVDSSAGITAPITGATGSQTIDVSGIAQGWASGLYTNYGLRIRPGTIAQSHVWSSSEDATASLRPKITIVYMPFSTITSPAGTVSNPASVADDTTPRISWTNGTGVTQSKYQVQITDVAGNLVVDSGQVSSADVFYDCATALTYGAVYKVRVQIFDGTYWTGYTDWSYFICALSAPSDFTATANSDHARIDLTWTGNSEAAGYNIYRRNDGATTWELVNLELVAGESYSDDYVQCGQAYEYTIASVASNGYEGEDDGTADVTLTFAGAWIADSQVHVAAPPNITRPRRASKRLDIRGKYVIQDWGFGERILDLALRYSSQAELDALLALFPTDTAVSYRDELGRAFRGKLADNVTDNPVNAWTVAGVINVTLTEVTP